MSCQVSDFQKLFPFIITLVIGYTIIKQWFSRKKIYLYLCGTRFLKAEISRNGIYCKSPYRNRKKNLQETQGTLQVPNIHLVSKFILLPFYITNNLRCRGVSMKKFFSKFLLTSYDIYVELSLFTIVARSVSAE